MAIDTYPSGGVVSQYPSMTEVINKKGFVFGSNPGKWGEEDGLIKLSNTDINPLSPTKPHDNSLFSFRGYDHFYKVMPDGFEQNEKGRPDNYAKYAFEEPDDTAFGFCELNKFAIDDSKLKWLPFNFFPQIYLTATKMSGAMQGWIKTGFRDGFPTINVTENNTSATRYGYAYFTYQPPTSGAVANRKFGLYISQSATNTLPGEPEIPPPVNQYNGWYWNGRPAPESSMYNPIYLSHGTTTFLYGGGGTRPTCDVNQKENNSMECELDPVNPTAQDWTVWRLTITVPIDSENSMIFVKAGTSPEMCIAFINSY